MHPQTLACSINPASKGKKIEKPMDPEIEKSREMEIERNTDGQHLKKSMWKPEEDMLLKRYVETYGEGKWSSISKKLGLLRDGKSCRLRWKNYLRPDIKHGGMSKDEEDLIIRMHKLLGNRWSLIAGRLPGRTDNEVKNYWNTHLSKTMARRAKRKSITSNVDNDEKSEPNQAQRARFEQDNSKENHDRSPPRMTPNTHMDGAQEEENRSSLTGDHLLSGMGSHTTQNLNWSFMDMENAFLVYGVDVDQPWGSLAWGHASYLDLFDALGSEFDLCDV